MAAERYTFGMEFLSCDPSTGETVYTRPGWSVDRLEQAISRLRQHQHAWRTRPIDERVARIRRLGELIEANVDRLAPVITLEVGKLIHEARAELEKTARLCHYYADLAPTLLQPQTIPTSASRSGVSFEPLGLVFAVMPWNYPVWQALRFAVPALAAGNGCLLKPAPTVPQSTALLLELMQEADIPVFDVAWIDVDGVETAIAGCDAVAFTGSTRTGRLIASLAGKHIKKTVLELGGSNPVLILRDADLATAAQECAMSRFRDAGQSCNAAKRLIVVPEIAEDFLQAFMAEVSRLTPGDPRQPGTTLAPLHRADLRAQLHDQVTDACRHGARCLSGGQLPDGPGFYYPATVLDHVTSACRIYHEEAFGPAASILRAENEADAVRLANDTPFGLGAAVYSQDLPRAERLARDIEAGSVFINRHTSSDLRLPFGGVKASGYGRELSEFGLYEFVNVKTFWQR